MRTYAYVDDLPDMGGCLGVGCPTMTTTPLARIPGWTNAVRCHGCTANLWHVLDGTWTCRTCGRPMHANPTDPETEPEAAFNALLMGLVRTAEGVR